jgi:para-aminobenzoate synthetase/4-amino-4-deoxychorismate lyase
LAQSTPDLRAAAAPDLAGLPRPFVLLEDRLEPQAPARLFTQPRAVIRCDHPSGVEAAFDRLETALDQGLRLAGFFAYELGYVLESALAAAMPPRRPGPLLWFGAFPPPAEYPAPGVDAAFAALGPPAPISDLAPGHGLAEHTAKARRILDLIAAGDVYQVNLTFPFAFRYGGDPLALYGALRARQPVAHGGVVAFEDGCVLSVSPELFVEARRGRALARPMKGTAPRALEPSADHARRAALCADPKQRAENLMITDLLRNDLSRVSAPGSVAAPVLFGVETYPTFHALTSTVTARLRRGLRLRELVGALFPCGSVVGAPKVRAAEIIRELEAAPRGVYAGAVGEIGPAFGSDLDLSLNVAIRTVALDAAGRGVYGVGGGIVADSDPQAEYDEALLKARPLADLARDYGLIETFRWSQAEGHRRLDAHLGRLAASAARLGFRFDRAEASARLAALDVQLRSAPGDRRVRLLLDRAGELAISHETAAAPSGRDLRVGVASEALDAADPFLRHKTTRRELHERAFAEAAGRGLDEALLLGRDGRIADAARASVFLAVRGRLLTPPLDAGALPGVLRAELLATGRAAEAELTLDDLAAADRWFLGSSLHGLRRGQLAPAGVSAGGSATNRAAGR